MNWSANPLVNHSIIIVICFPSEDSGLVSLLIFVWFFLLVGVVFVIVAQAIFVVVVIFFVFNWFFFVFYWAFKLIKYLSSLLLELLNGFAIF